MSPKDRSLTTATGEVKGARIMVKFRRFGLLAVLLGRFPTGSSLCATRSHEINYLDHSVPLCTTSYP